MNKTQKKEKKRKRVKRMLPILPLDKAIKRLADEEVWRKVSKGTPFDKND